MSISVVKNNMYQSYSSIGQLENSLNQLINILNMVDGSTSNMIISYIPTIEYTSSNVKRLFEKMYHLNSVELHILFSELNSKNKDMIFKIGILERDLKELKRKSIERYEFYKYYQRMEFLLDRGVYDLVMNVSELKHYIPSLISLKIDLQLFKFMIDSNNNKLRVGVRR